MFLLVQRLFVRAPELLLFAAVLVGIAILVEGSAGRAVSGIAGVLWISASVTLVREAMGGASRGRLLVAILAIDLTLVLVVQPSSLVWAAIGFAGGGALIAAIAPDESKRSVLLLPACWLPVHLTVAIARAVDRALRDVPATIRTDPPPTAALVPLAMVASAYIGGWFVTWLRDVWRRRRTAAAAT